jgi:Tol biopolymer transport system component
MQKDSIIITPDYANIVLPCNIAPLNFNIQSEADEYLTVVYSSKGNKLLARGKKVQFPIKQWKKLLEENKGDTLYIDVYLKKNSQWLKYLPLKNQIAPDAIDNFIAYRLIEPSYVTYETMSINQRNLTNFDENVIFSNRILAKGEQGQCINCHSFRKYNQTGDMQFHVRQYLGGTVIIRGDVIQKINLKNEHTISAGVYPSWHPTENLIAYSTNDTGQNFHTNDNQKVEVMDSKSDLILYDIDKNEISVIADDPTLLETFPSWSNDGKKLYYVAAAYPVGINGNSQDIYLQYDKFQYNLYRKAFNTVTREFSSADTLFEASEYGKSVAFPRESPDGKYLLFTLGDYGNFHIWHKSSDLYLLDLETKALSALTALNSSDVESYHSWSSNGRWIIFSSRRDDGSYTRLYIAYFKDGQAFKPFILPQEDPDFYGNFFKSYNISEFMTQAVSVSPNELANVIQKEAKPAIFNNSKEKSVAKQKYDGKENFYE